MQRLFLLFALTLSFGCSKLQKIETIGNDGKLKESYFIQKKSGAREGAYKVFHPNGNLMEESFYKNDSLDGERKIYYETGKLLSTEHYDMGKFVRTYQKFFENGQVSNKGEYVNNEMSGVWKRWYEDGRLREEVAFVGNLENGPFREFHPNGNIKTEGEYLGGDFENGELKKYDETGQLFERMYCESGICMTVWSLSRGEIQIDSAKLRQLVELKKKLN